LLTEIAIDTARERLTSCSPALFWEVLGHMRVPPFGHRQSPSAGRPDPVPGRNKDNAELRMQNAELS